jgi:BlaI family transcriptional regulator, penicillinase repressor
MPRRKSFEPTEREFAILEILWKRKSCTVRDVQEALSEEEDVGRTTVLKLMQIMYDKGLVKRDESEHSHTYTATMSQEDMQKQMVGRFMKRVFGGSALSLMTRALAVKGASKKDTEKIQKLLGEMEMDNDDAE